MPQSTARADIRPKGLSTTPIHRSHSDNRGGLVSFNHRAARVVGPSPSSAASSSSSESNVEEKRRDAALRGAMAGLKVANVKRPMQQDPAASTDRRDSGIVLPRRPPSDWVSPDAAPVKALKEPLTPSYRFGDQAVGLTVRHLLSSSGELDLKAVKGLTNLGNTCFMNSVLQCLSATIPLAKLLREGSYQEWLNRSDQASSHGQFARATARLISVMWRQEYSSVSPVAMHDILLKRAPQFKGDDQQDAQECLTAILDNLHEDMNVGRRKSSAPAQEAKEPRALSDSDKAWRDYLKRERSPILSWFSGQEQNVLCCNKCTHKSTSFEPLWCISLTLPKATSKKVTLVDLLDVYCKSETLKGSKRIAKWNCPQCKKPREATKTLSLSRLPPILCLQISRVTQDGHLPSKNSMPIAYPVHSFDTSRFNKRGGLYDLYGVVCHFGPAGLGHYTASVRRSKDQWATISDNVVMPCSLDEIRRGHRDSCYLLFYALQG